MCFAPEIFQRHFEGSSTWLINWKFFIARCVLIFLEHPLSRTNMIRLGFHSEKTFLIVLNSGGVLALWLNSWGCRAFLKFFATVTVATELVATCGTNMQNKTFAVATCKETLCAFYQMPHCASLSGNTKQKKFAISELSLPIQGSQVTIIFHIESRRGGSENNQPYLISFDIWSM